MRVEWKDGTHLRKAVDAQAVYNELQQVAQTEELTPERVVEVARNEASALNGLFPWSDKEAAAEFRRQEATKIVRCLVEKDSGIPVFIRLPRNEAAEETKTTVYVAVRSVTQDETRQEILQRERQQLAGHERQLSALLRAWGLGSAPARKAAKARTHVGKAVRALA